MVEKDWKLLLDLTGLIASPHVQDLVVKKLNEAPEYFRNIPASSSGKYHPKYALGDGGLVRHTIVSVMVGVDLCGLDYFQVDANDRDNILAALFLHDTYKSGKVDAGHTVRNHPQLAADSVESESTIIARYVRTHMGQWGNNKPGNLKEFLVHIADLIASRRMLEADFDYIREQADKLLKEGK